LRSRERPTNSTEDPTSGFATVAAPTSGAEDTEDDTDDDPEEVADADDDPPVVQPADDATDVTIAATATTVAASRAGTAFREPTRGADGTAGGTAAGVVGRGTQTLVVGGAGPRQSSTTGRRGRPAGARNARSARPDRGDTFRRVPSDAPRPGGRADRDVDVLVVGDLNPDLVLRGDVIPRFGQAEQLLEAADLELAGSAGIMAAGCARLGLRTALVAHVGRDAFGDLVLSRLADRGVLTDAVVVHDDVPTGVSVILSTPGDRAILTLPGAMTRCDPDDVPEALLARARHVHLASWFLLPALADRGTELLRRARTAGCSTSLDTNWDPAERWTGVAQALPHLDVLLPNQTELVAIGATLGSAPDLADAARLVLDHGPTVEVKAGAAGAIGWDGTGRHQRPGLTLDVVDTTGAGDSFDAGFLAARLAGHDLGTSLRWAAVAGSLSTRAPGGTRGQATLAELTALVRQG
jgi:sugar/nucleoside kinase (ribokinase family)